MLYRLEEVVESYLFTLAVLVDQRGVNNIITRKEPIEALGEARNPVEILPTS